MSVLYTVCPSDTGRVRATARNTVKQCLNCCVRAMPRFALSLHQEPVPWHTTPLRSSRAAQLSARFGAGGAGPFPTARARRAVRLGGTACWRVRVDRMRAGSVVRVGLLTAALRPGEPRPARRRTDRSHCAGRSDLFRYKRPHLGPSRRPANPSPPAFTARVIRWIAGRKRRRRAMKVYDAGRGVRGVGAPSGLLSAAAWFAAQAIASPVPRVHRLQMCVWGGEGGGSAGDLLASVGPLGSLALTARK